MAADLPPQPSDHVAVGIEEGDSRIVRVVRQVRSRTAPDLEHVAPHATDRVLLEGRHAAFHGGVVHVVPCGKKTLAEAYTLPSWILSGKGDPTSRS